MCVCIQAEAKADALAADLETAATDILQLRKAVALRGLCCSVLQCVAVCCRVLQCVVVCCSMLQVCSQ